MTRPQTLDHLSGGCYISTLFLHKARHLLSLVARAAPIASSLGAVAAHRIPENSRWSRAPCARSVRRPPRTLQTSRIFDETWRALRMVAAPLAASPARICSSASSWVAVACHAWLAAALACRPLLLCHLLDVARLVIVAGWLFIRVVGSPIENCGGPQNRRQASRGFGAGHVATQARLVPRGGLAPRSPQRQREFTSWMMNLRSGSSPSFRPCACGKDRHTPRRAACSAGALCRCPSL